MGDNWCQQARLPAPTSLTHVVFSQTCFRTFAGQIQGFLGWPTYHFIFTHSILDNFIFVQNQTSIKIRGYSHSCSEFSHGAIVKIIFLQAYSFLSNTILSEYFHVSVHTSVWKDFLSRSTMWMKHQPLINFK